MVQTRFRGSAASAETPPHRTHHQLVPDNLPPALCPPWIPLCCLSVADISSSGHRHPGRPTNKLPSDGSGTIRSVAATDLADIHQLTPVNWLQATDPVHWIHGRRFAVNRHWWTAELTKHGLSDTILSDSITRGDIFNIAEPALDDPAAAAGCSCGTRSRRAATTVNAITGLEIASDRR